MNPNGHDVDVCRPQSARRAERRNVRRGEQVPLGKGFVVNRSPARTKASSPAWLGDRRKSSGPAGWAGPGETVQWGNRTADDISKRNQAGRPA